MEHVRAQASIDRLVERFFAVFDNRNGSTPRLAELTGCFADKATVVRHSDAGTELFTVSEFAVPRIELLAHGALLDFHEWEISATTRIFDGIATRLSRYGKAGLLNGSVYGGSGTKCFQFARLGADWRITALAWVDDSVQPLLAESGTTEPTGG